VSILTLGAWERGDQKKEELVETHTNRPDTVEIMPRSGAGENPRKRKKSTGYLNWTVLGDLKASGSIRVFSQRGISANHPGESLRIQHESKAERARKKGDFSRPVSWAKTFSTTPDTRGLKKKREKIL